MNSLCRTTLYVTNIGVLEMATLEGLMEETRKGNGAGGLMPAFRQSLVLLSLLAEEPHRAALAGALEPVLASAIDRFVSLKPADPSAEETTKSS
jgi:hypothetical protein